MLRLRPVGVFCALLLTLGGAAWAQDEVPPPAAPTGSWLEEIPWEEIHESYIRDRLSAGLRWTFFALTDDSQQEFDAGGTFIGGFTTGISIDRLDESHEWFPTLYLRWEASDYVSIEFAWEKLVAATRTYWDGHTDGDVILSGPSLLVVGRYPNDTDFTPYAGIGLAFLDGEFDHAPWGQGYHIIRADGTYGLLLQVGCSTPIADRVHFDLTLRYMMADSDAHFYLHHGGGRTTNHAYWTFPLDNFGAHLGFRYAF